MAGRETRSGRVVGPSSNGENVDPMAEMMGRLAQALESIGARMHEPQPNPNPPQAPEPVPQAERVTLGHFMQQGPKTFEGVKDPIEAEEWLSGLEKIYDAIDCTDRQKVQWAIYKLAGEADQWWKATRQTKTAAQLEALTWDSFKELFNDKYFPQIEKDKMEEEFLRLKQKEDETVLQYEARFTRMSRYAEHQVNNEGRRVKRFVKGLKPSIRLPMAAHELPTFGVALTKAQKVESERQQCKDERDAGNSSQGKRKKEEKHDGQSDKKVRTEKSQPCPKCQKMHKGECLLGTKACFSCGKVGHLAKDCRMQVSMEQMPLVQQGPAQEQGQRLPPICFNCGEKGHISRVCRNPRMEKQKQLPQQQKGGPVRQYAVMAKENEAEGSGKGKEPENVERLCDFAFGRS